MAHKVFIDSDVIIDFFTDRGAHANAASRIFQLGEIGKVKLYTSSISITNVYYVVRKILGHKTTLSVIDDLVEMVEIAGTSKKELTEALQSDLKDFEDSVQHSTALNIKGLEAVLTRNTKDYSAATIAIFTPANYLKTIKSEV